jgi:hypothetical protein
MAVGPISGPGTGPVFGEGGIPLPKLEMGNAAADRLVPGIAKALETVDKPEATTTYEQRRIHSQKLMQMLMLLKNIVENKRARGESIDEEEDKNNAKDSKDKKKPDEVQPTPAVPRLS